MIKKIVLSLLIFVFGIGLLVVVSTKTSTTMVVEHSFDASPERVWKHWTEPESMKRWWSPKHYTATVIENDPRVDGKFLFSMKAPDGKMHWNTGRYIEVVPYHKMVSLMSFSDERGKVIPASQLGMPGTWADEIKVTVEFHEMGGRTKIVVKEEGIPTIMYVFAKMGWNQQFEKFEHVLTP